MPSKELGEIEIKPDGKAIFKKLRREGRVLAVKNQVAIQLGSQTYYFTKKGNQLVEGIANPTPEILSFAQSSKGSSASQSVEFPDGSKILIDTPPTP